MFLNKYFHFKRWNKSADDDFYTKGIKLNGKTLPFYTVTAVSIFLVTPNFSVSKCNLDGKWRDLCRSNLRGGGEYGKKWHVAGTQMQKKNVFEDFIAAGEYLQKNGLHFAQNLWHFLAVQNGGLLVGATMTMRPDLEKVAFPGVGVLDMLRYNKFTAGAGWSFDYGTAGRFKEMFEYLKSYSPVHNVRKGVCYPSTMIITSDHDDRVVPHTLLNSGQNYKKNKVVTTLL